MRIQRLIPVVIVAVAGLAAVAAASGVGRDGRETNVPNLEQILNAREAPRAHAEQRVGGSDWSITTVRTTDGKFCAGEAVPGEGQAVSCWVDGTLFADGPLVVQAGARQLAGNPAATWHNIWVWGLVAPQITAVELITTGCRSIRLEPDAAGVFLHVMSKNEHARGWPAEVRAYTADGQIAATRALKINAPDTAAAKAAGAAAPGRSACT